MPLHFCHPNTPHKKLKLPEWYISTLMMDRALDAIMRRVKSLDRNHLVTLGVSTGHSPGVWGWYSRLHSLETLDFLGFHDYGSDDVPLPGAPVSRTPRRARPP